MEVDKNIAKWAEYFSCVEADKIVHAVTSLAGLNSNGIKQCLLDPEPSVDTYVSAFLLQQSIDKLTEAGVTKTKIKEKLNRPSKFWSAYSELRAGSLLLEHGSNLQYEPFGDGPDFMINFQDQEIVIELKSVGLSKPEANYAKKLEPHLAGLLPAKGQIVWDSRDYKKLPQVPEKEQYDLDAAGIYDHYSDFPHELAAVTVRCFGDTGYARRVVKLATKKVVKQIKNSPAKTGWAGFWWNSGCSVKEAFTSFDWDETDSSLEGILVFVEAIVFPDRNIHRFVLPLPRDSEIDSVLPMSSNLSRGHPETVFEIIEATPGPGLMMMRDISNGTTIMNRCGQSPLSSFYFMLEPEREESRKRGDVLKVKILNS